MGKNKKIFAVVLGGLAVAGVAFFLVFGGGNKDSEELKAAFRVLTTAEATGKKSDVEILVSKKFNDAGLDYNAAVEELSIKRAGMRVDISDVRLREGQADISYIRKEIIDKKPVSTKIVNETWVKEDDGKWRLIKFSDADRVQIPKLSQARKELEEQAKAKRMAEEAAEAAARNVAYSAAGKRDPFESLIVEGAGEEGGAGDAANKCEPERKRDFMEGFDLLSFKMVGILYINGYYALVEAQNGNGYTLKPGMYIGRHCGRVLKIMADRVIITEKHSAIRGGFVDREVELKLKEAE